MHCKQLTISLTCYQHCKCLRRVVQLVNTHHFHVANVLHDHVHRLPERKQYTWREEGASLSTSSHTLHRCTCSSKLLQIKDYVIGCKLLQIKDYVIGYNLLPRQHIRMLLISLFYSDVA